MVVVWRLAVVVAVLTVALPCPGKPTIEITGVPPYGSEGYLEGVVTGVENPADYCVAPYIQVEGSGWWTKPTFAEPCVPVNADGSFRADVTIPETLDSRATLYAVRLLPAGQVPTEAAGDSSLPDCPLSLAFDTLERFGRALSFAGLTWGVKDAPIPVGPGPNRFSPEQGEVWVDASDRLHLTVRQKAGQWYSTEVVLTESLGYGQYLFQTSSRVDDLDSNVVFGAFTWDAYGDPALPEGRRNREIDFEDGRWTDPDDPLNSQFVVQPWNTPGNRHRFAVPDLGQDARLTRILTWEEGRLHFLVLTGHHTVDDWLEDDIIAAWEYFEDPGAGHFVPEPGDARFRFNLWLVGGLDPRGDGETEVVVDHFAFALVTLVWTGAEGPVWDVGQTDNWSQHGSLRPYRNGDRVVLDDTAVGPSVVEIAETVRPAAVLVDNAAVDFEWAGPGAIAGACGLVKRGGGTLAIATANAYTSGSRIEGGTVVIASEDALGAGIVSLGDTSGSTDAILLVAGPFTVDNDITVQDDGDAASTRTLGGTGTSGTAVFSGDLTLGKDLLLTAEPGGEVRLEGALDNAAGHTLIKVGGGTVIFDGFQDHGAGSLLEVHDGLLVLHTDASGTGLMDDAHLSALVAGAELHFGCDQHLDTLTISDGGLVRFTGANVVVVKHLVMNGIDLGAMTLTPEPATLALLAAGGVVSVWRRRRQ